jgi:outer membrane protein assembly factor BamB/mono/diheme cytochrome c family protein
VTEKDIGLQAGIGLVAFLLSQILLVGFAVGFIVGHFTGHSKTVTAASLVVPGKAGEVEPTVANAREGIGPEREMTAWSTPNGDRYNHRTAISEIEASNVDELGVAWKLPITVDLDNTFVPAAKFGDFASTPVFDGEGHVFFQDAANNVTAVDTESGEEIWKKEWNLPNEGPNGVTLAEGNVYGCTSTFCFALDAETGEEVWKSPVLINSVAEAEEGLEKAAEIGANTETGKGIELQGQGINFAPQVNNGVVFVSTSGQITGGRAIALDAETGEVMWKTEETKEEDERAIGGVDGTGGSWNAPAIGPDGSAYFGIGNPYRSDDQAINQATELLYNDSTIALDPNSGKVDWYMQGVPNDFYDWDMQISPVYVEEEGTELVLDAGKMGYVYAIDPSTGKLVWKTPVGTHNGHDEDGKLALEGKYHPTKYPYKVYPGSLGGVETNMAVDEGVAYVPIVNSYQERPDAETQLGGGQELGESTGAMAAVQVATGKVLWETTLHQPAFGAATIANDLVFTTLYDGSIVALERSTGKIVWEEKLPGGTNSPLVIEGTQLIAVNSVPTGSEKPQIVAYELGAIEAGAAGGEAAGAPEAEGGETEGGEGPAEEAVREAQEGAEGEPGAEVETEAAEGEEAEATEGAEEAEGEEGAAEGEAGEEEAAAGGEASEAMLTEGKTAFTTNCASCHTLSEAGTSGHVGPNLDELMPEDSLVETQVTNGGGGMPAFGGTLSKAEIEAIAAYVSSAAGTGNDTLGGKTTGGGGGV